MKKINGYKIAITGLLLTGIWLWHYSHVTACPGVAIYVKCKNYW